MITKNQKAQVPDEKLKPRRKLPPTHDDVIAHSPVPTGPVNHILEIAERYLSERFWEGGEVGGGGGAQVVQYLCALSGLRVT